MNIILVCIYVSIILLVMIITLKSLKRIILPNTLFTLIWCLCGIFSIYNNLGLIKPSIRIHIYIFITVATFNLIYFMSKLNIKYKNQEKEIIYDEYCINYKVVYLIIFISIILISPNMFKAFKIIISNGFNLSDVRQEVYMAVTNSSSPFIPFFTKTIPNSAFTTLSIISSIEIFKYSKKKLLYLNIMCIIISTITFGGRSLVMNAIIFYFATFIVVKKYKKIKIKKSYIIIGIIMLFIMTVSRGMNGLSFIDMIINYFVGSFSYLEVILRNPSLFGLDGGFMYGYLTFGFFFEPIVLTLKLLLGASIEIPSYYFNIYAQSFINIGETRSQFYNNNTTMLYTFLRDFGQVGIVIGTVIIAVLVCFLEKKYNRKRDLRALILLVYMYSVIINSVMMYTITSIFTSLVIIFSFIFVKRIRT